MNHGFGAFCGLFVSLLWIGYTQAATFGDDVAFLRNHFDVIVLKDDNTQAKVALVPAWQGRVATSTLAGDSGDSFGWINRELISSSKTMPHINAFGGEERFWLGPEGSQYSIYFSKGEPFNSTHWDVPPPLDTLPFSTASHSDDHAVFEANFTLTNYVGTQLSVSVKRDIHLLSRKLMQRALNLPQLDEGLQLVGYESVNTLTNAGKQPWRKDSGLLSIWILGMFNASPSVTVVIPIKAGTQQELGKPVTIYASFGSLTPDRLKTTDTSVFFRGDARFRSKIGVRPQRSLGRLGSYDADRNVLTLIQFSQPEGMIDYVNSVWGVQKKPYRGDALNSYNDGPPSADAPQLGHFFELESSSPAAELRPGASIEHTHRTFHLSGARRELDAVARSFLEVSLQAIETALPSTE